MPLGLLQIIYWESIFLYFNTKFNFVFLQYILLLQTHTHTHTLHLQETCYTTIVSIPSVLALLLLCPSLPRYSPPTSSQQRPTLACCCTPQCFLCWWSFSQASANHPGRLQPNFGFTYRKLIPLHTFGQVLLSLPSAPRTHFALLSLGRLRQEYCCKSLPVHPGCKKRKTWLSDWFLTARPASIQRLCWGQTSLLECLQHRKSQCNK